MYKLFQFIFDVIRVTLIPAILIALFIFKLIPLNLFIICLVCLSIIYFIFPLMFKFSLTLQRFAVFMSFISLPLKSKLKYPEKFGLYATRNFYIKVNDPNIKNDIKEIKIGVWHILPTQLAKLYSKELQLNSKQMDSILNATANPKYANSAAKNYEHTEKDETYIRSEFSIVNNDNENLFYERMLQLPGTIVLYLHGNTSNRGFSHRIQLYKVLRKLGHHVIAFDYRNFGDSDPIPQTEDGVVTDALAVYDYIRNLTDNPIFVWGHSLGTAISTHLLARLNELKRPEPLPRALVLESPFTNMREEARAHLIVKPFKWLLPWFDYMFVKPLLKNDFRFESDLYICKFRQPVLILHAADDCIVPFRLGNKLYKRACNNRESTCGSLRFHRFKITACYGHAFLYRDPSLPEILKAFFDVHRDRV